MEGDEDADWDWSKCKRVAETWAGDCKMKGVEGTELEVDELTAVEMRDETPMMPWRAGVADPLGLLTSEAADGDAKKKKGCETADEDVADAAKRMGGAGRGAEMFGLPDRAVAAKGDVIGREIASSSGE